MANADIQRSTQFLVDIKVVVRTEHIALETTTIIQTIDLIIGQGGYRLHSLITSRDGQRVSHTWSTVVQYQTLPIGNWIIIRIRLVILHPILGLVGGVNLEETTRRVVIVLLLIIHLQITSDTHHTRLLSTDFPTKLCVIFQVYLSRIITTLGSHQDDTSGGLGTIDTSSGSILQYRDALHIIGIHIVKRTFHAIHDDQWTRLTNSGDTTHTDAAGT